MSDKIHGVIKNIAGIWAEYMLSVLSCQENMIIDDLRRHLSNKLSQEEINGVVNIMHASFSKSKESISVFAENDNDVSDLADKMDAVSLESEESSEDCVDDASDDAFVKDDLEKKTMAELKNILRGKGLPLGGNKSKLVDRLLNCNK